MISVSVVTLGCKVNQAESTAIIAALNEKTGYHASEGLSTADVYVLNTCSVTAEADRKSRQYLSKMRKLNDKCRIIVIGCSSQNNAEHFAKNNVTAIGGSENKVDFVIDNIKEISESILHDRILFNDYSEKNSENCEKFSKNTQKTRKFVKIQDGCNRFCTYCIIPYLRGRSKSVPINDIVAECERTDSDEIVLTGIDMSDYGKDIGSTLSELLSKLSHIQARKRISSLECEVIDEDMLSIMREGNYCPHFHLSLQSGDDGVLKSMNRHYDTNYFYSKVELIRQFFPNAGITTDIIVGFPTETDEKFENSCKFIEKCAFSDIHVFPYSARTGTLASKKYKTLPKTVVEERVNKLLEIKHALHKAFIESNLGKAYTVYTEDAHDGLTEGYTQNYIKVYCSGAPCGKMIDMRLTKPYKDGAYAQIIDVADNNHN
ncbi:MAG: tRNA (N(6)-L-threonylcarbamoyladenosine(37)-C(2))-methylthiotransferase MtaB [Clostridiales bacterium]|nr:tRNA (N(6)-L-threonylcarbamoyladenosine(37)-C(2))-methylthiotransferase MtaB [Clostridiales bacterium]